MTQLIEERALLDLHEDVLKGRMDGTCNTTTINLEHNLTAILMPPSFSNTASTIPGD